MKHFPKILFSFCLMTFLSSCQNKNTLSILSPHFEVRTNNPEHIHFFSSHLDDIYKKGEKFESAHKPEKNKNLPSAIPLAQTSMPFCQFTFDGKKKISYSIDFQAEGSTTLSTDGDALKEIIIKKNDLDILLNKIKSLKTSQGKNTVFTPLSEEGSPLLKTTES